MAAVKRERERESGGRENYTVHQVLQSLRPEKLIAIYEKEFPTLEEPITTKWFEQFMATRPIKENTDQFVITLIPEKNKDGAQYRICGYHLIDEKKTKYQIYTSDWEEMLGWYVLPETLAVYDRYLIAAYLIYDATYIDSDHDIRREKIDTLERRRLENALSDGSETDSSEGSEEGEGEGGEGKKEEKEEKREKGKEVKRER